jgi:hypothetical protein
MKATSIKEYQRKFQPDVSLYMETAWTEGKAQISKKVLEKMFCFFLSVHAVSK